MAALDALDASFSASFALRVPFFLGGAAVTAGNGFSSSDSEDASQSLWECVIVRLEAAASSREAHHRVILVIVFTLPFALHGLFLSRWWR
jgi:hypothetical protein